MLLQNDDFREVFGAGGERFERLMQDLVRTETRRLGFADNDVHWDQRTNVADGGCDIWVTKGHTDASSFLPLKPPSISLKSGEDGTKLATFENEVRKHETLIRRLEEGNSFLWCCPRPISQERRDEFVAKATELATEFKIDKGQFSFFWIDAISERVERSPHLIAAHLPNAWRRLDGLSLVRNWKPDDREPVRNEAKWVNFDGRDAVKQIIRQHLSGTGAGNRLLHIAGLSGAGKTRTVIEACRDEPSLDEVVYCPSRSGSVENLLNHLDATSGSALLVIDEVSLDDYDSLARRIERMPPTVRVVSIGPARATERERGGILVLAPPSTVDHVAAVARAAGGILGDDVIRNIANFAGKDLRLALLLVEAALQTQEPQFVPLRDNRDVWKRLRDLFKHHITCPDFDHHYGLLTTTIDIGVGGRAREELSYLAKHFDKSIGTMEACVRDAVSTGLGSKPFDYFEPTPRALAQWLFIEQAWPALKDRVDQFLENCPSNRLQKKFLERCQELPERDRQEVMTVVSDFFLKRFGEPRLSRLTEGRESKLFQTWAETDPEVGLNWLSRATASATLDDFATFNGANDYTGGWNGRRQVVWLCEHLSCFKEYFRQAEDIIFRLSHLETEKSIANNGTNIWVALFHPWMSFTEVPFVDRLRLLLERLRKAEGRSLELVVAAAVFMIGDGGMRAVPPAVVGGRVRPTEWKPRTRGELFSCMQSGGKEFLTVATTLPKDRQLFILAAITPNIGRFFDLRLLDELRNWVTAAIPEEDLVRELRKEIDSWLSWSRAHMDDKSELVGYVDRVQQWRDSLQPRTLIERVQDLTSRDYWEHFREVSRAGKEVSQEEATREADALYRSVAQELLADVTVFRSLHDWFESSSNKSSLTLAQKIAQLDSDERTHAVVGQWIGDGTAISTCAGFLLGLAAERRHSAAIDEGFERLAATQPGAALRLSASADFSERGFDRIIRCLKVCRADDLWGLRPLATYSWRDILNEERILVLMQELRRLQQLEGYRKVTGTVAVDILRLIYSTNQVGDPTLAKVILQILADATRTSSRDSWDWVRLAKSVLSHDPKLVCRLAVTRLVESGGGSESSLEDFVAECAKSEPDEAMDAVRKVFADKKNRWSLRVLTFRGLFDSIGLPTVSRYVEANPTHSPFIARHLESPGIDESGNLYVPELADWLLSRFGENTEVWDEFMMGRHAFEVFAVPQGYEAVTDIANRFVDHPTAWVRKWAVAEIAQMNSEIEVHRREEDRRERE